MDGVKKKTKKVAVQQKGKSSKLKQAMKVKKEKKKLSNLMPRMSLEPYLNPSVPPLTPSPSAPPCTPFAPLLLPTPPISVESETDIEKHRKLVVLVDSNEVDRYLKNYGLQGASCKGTNGINRKKPFRSSLPTGTEVKRNLSASFINFKNIDGRAAQEGKAARKSKLVCRGKWWWSDVELKNLALGLQQYGFADLEKVASVVKTKKVADIALFLEPRRWEFHKEQNYDPNLPRGKCFNRFTTTYPEHLKTWPNIRKWRRMAYEQVIPHVRKTDYSEPVMEALFKQFYEEEGEPENPQVINVKLIYKYLMDCMAGEIPPQLPPKESALVLDMLREIRSLPIMYDFDEEKDFFRKYTAANNFRPLRIKDEFMKKLKDDVKDVIFSPNTIPVVEEVFLELSRHKKLLQSFNPLVTPVYMIQRSQEHVKNYSEETNVYVD